MKALLSDVSGFRNYWMNHIISCEIINIVITNSLRNLLTNSVLFIFTLNYLDTSRNFCKRNQDKRLMIALAVCSVSVLRVAQM